MGWLSIQSLQYNLNHCFDIQRMKEIYLLLPLLTTNNKVQWQIERVMNITPQQYQLHEISQSQFAVQLRTNQLGYAELEGILREQEEMSVKMAMMESALASYDWQQKEASMQASSIDSLMKKAMKYKEVKDENRKLKKLLQHQLENTEKVREETQKTMRVLREEFDTLVKEMSKQNGEREKIKIPQKENYQGRTLNKF